MDARLTMGALAATLLFSFFSLGADHRTANFVVSAPSDAMARELGDTAEQLRRDLAVEWLGTAMPNWSQPCPLVVQVGRELGAGGATSFVFDHGEVFGWQMNIQGPYDRVLDSVLPHEITHTVFASYFRKPLPRWADEGGCSTVEHSSERLKQQQMLVNFLQTGRGIAFSQMFAMREYPRDILPLYAQGHSLATYLVSQGGKRKYVAFLSDGLERNEWANVVERHYGYTSLGILQNSWLDWVRRGSPPLEGSPVTLASNQVEVREPGKLVFRGQSPEPATPATAPIPTVTPGPVPYDEPSSAGRLVPVVRPSPLSSTATAEPGQVLIEWEKGGEGRSIYDARVGNGGLRR